MEQGAAESGFHALALGEAGGAAVGDGFQAEHRDHLLHALAEKFARHSAQLAEINQILPDGEPRINSDVIEQRPDAALARERVASGDDIVDDDRARFGFQHAADHAQRSGFARAVGSQ